MSLTLMYITNSPDVALIAQKYGVQRIWIDLETLGKEERQKNRDTVKSQHSIKDIQKLSTLLKQSELLVRVNPWNKRSKDEIEEVISAGADIIMLPMWKSTEEVREFIKAIGGRTKTTLLLETKEAEMCLDEVLKVNGIDEIHIGLNDLHLSYGLTFMFELLSNGTVKRICNKIKKVGIPYGFGGIARIGEGVIPAEKIIMEHYHLGSSRVILSRSFCNMEEIEDLDIVETLFEKNMKKLRDYEEYASHASEQEYLKNLSEINTCISQIIRKKGV